MEIKINLDDIFVHEEDESIEEAIKREVISQLVKTTTRGLGNLVQNQISKLINEEIAATIQSKMPTLIDDILNGEYVEVDRYGDRRGTTTFRQALVKTITEQCVYKKANYDSDKNMFTRAVDAVIKENIEAFKTSFKSLVDAEFTKQALSHATAALKTKLNI